MTEPLWKADLERDGFVHLPGVIDADVAARLAMLSLRSLDEYAASDDLVRTADGVPVKLTYPLGKYPEFLATLGSREIREVVDALLPRHDSVLTWEDVLIKPPSVGVAVGVHQDIGLDPTRDTVHSLGISLNGDRDNPVYFLPGSHRLGPLTREAVAALWRDCRDEFRPVETQAGDVVIHNVHCLHHSEANRSARPRATWYLEFRSLRSLLERGPWSEDWAQRRRAIWVHARSANGDDIESDESGAVTEDVARIEAGTESLRVPHVNDEVRYDPASPYNHFSAWSDDWKSSHPDPGGTHHVKSEDGEPLYQARFHEVLKFHPPGLAPVTDESGSYHITPDGNPAYPERYRRAFGFYEGFAAVQSAEGWFHLRPNGLALYSERHSWCGNFQDGRCPVRDAAGRYFHINLHGQPAYKERYGYAGDFRDGLAVVQNDAGEHTHIDADGHLLHGKWFVDLDVFHKGFARARDRRGWHHVDTAGQPLYERRFRNVEPFYNGQARVERHDGSLAVIGEDGMPLLQLRGPSRTTLEELSGDMVGAWKTQVIRAAVDLGVFEILPASAADLDSTLRLAPSSGSRLLRALLELDLVARDAADVYHVTERGAHLRAGHDLSLAAAAQHWGGPSYEAWRGLADALRTGKPVVAEERDDFFRRLADCPEELAGCHRTFTAYARHDYGALGGVWDFGVHESLVDAGGSTGELAFALLRTFPNLKATVFDLPEVERLYSAPAELEDRCRFVGGDIFRPWPVRSDAVALARVLHDWPDDDVRRILGRAREAMPRGGCLYVVEMVLDDDNGPGGLLDLNMLVMTGGRERTLADFEQLLSEAGFRLLSVIPTGTVNSLICAEAV